MQKTYVDVRYGVKFIKNEIGYIYIVSSSYICVIVL